MRRNYLYNLAYQLLAIILPVITTPYLARVLGAEGTGTYSYTISIVTYFTLAATLGITTYGQREIAFAQKDQKKKNKIFTELFILRAITTAISALLFYLFFGIQGEYALYFRILLIELIASFFDISWFFQGLEDFKKIMIRNFVIKILSLIAIFTFVKTANDTWIYILIYSATTLFGNLSLWFRLDRFVRLDFKGLNLKRHIKPMVALFLPQVAVQIYTVLDKTMIGAITSDMNEVGYYEQSQKIVRVLLTIITSLGTVMSPRIASQYASGDTESIKDSIKKSFNFFYLIGIPMAIGIAVTANNFVPVFYGQGYDKVKILLPLSSLLIIFVGTASIFWNQYLLPTKQEKYYTISVITAAILNVILNSLLIPSLSSIGATIGSLAAELIGVIIQYHFISKKFKVASNFKLCKNYLIAGIIMGAAVYLVGTLVSASNLITLIVEVLTGVAVYTLMLAILKDEFLINTKSQLKSKLKRKP